MSAEVLQAEVHYVWSDTAPDPACSRLKLEQAGHDSYARSLQASLSLRKDIVLDMTSLKTCLDPEALPEAEAMEEEEAGEERGAKFDYEGFLQEWLDQEETNLVLETLVIRNLKLPCSNSHSELYNYASLLQGLMQTTTLVEVDLSGNPIPESLQPQLQFWSLHNAKKLHLDSTGLKALPPSVGRMKKLETLSLRKNKLTDLPVTLSFCEKIKVLHLQGNSFRFLPGVILQLKNLTELSRLDNPLPARWNGFASAPHLKRQGNTSAAKPKEGVVYNPDSLQLLCTRQVFASRMQYWKHDVLGPLQCKMIDCLAAHSSICHKCNTAVPVDKDHAVEVMLLEHAGLKDVFFKLHVCSPRCQEDLVVEYSEQQKKTQKRLDAEYEEMVRTAQQSERGRPINNSISSIATTFNPPSYSASDPRVLRLLRRQGRQGKKCTIM